MLTANLPGSLQAARLHATYGSVLARFGHRARAVMALEDARARFATMGARPYRERVEAELADLGRPQRRPTPAGELTPTEAVVARLVASGLSNNEVAARLVVSRKAVEYHLGNIYPKVGISTRGQLAARLGSLGTKRTPDQPKD
jgi:DNA-binding NarL/FixJ family response regulator